MESQGQGKVLLVFLLLWSSCDGRDFTFTFQLPAGRSECFYEFINEGAFMEIEYQVARLVSVAVCPAHIDICRPYCVEDLSDTT